MNFRLTLLYNRPAEARVEVEVFEALQTALKQ